jgi:hypothetical protein
MPENILILADWTLAGIVVTRCRRETPTAMMTRKKKTRRRRGTISRQSSGKPTNSPHPRCRV